VKTSKKIVIFGGSEDCKKFLRDIFSLVLCELMEVVAICDNDSRIQGNLINGISIISPDELANYQYDKIVVTPIFFNEIKELLMSRGVEKDKIEPYWHNFSHHFDRKARRFGNCEVGKYSYFKGNTTIWNANIGSFCHIGDNCIIGQAGHDPNLITTYPLRYHFSNEISDCALDFTGDRKKLNKKTIIKNDVYIGESVVVVAGVTIGNGAVIASKSLVTKDVDDYVIVGGVPAKLIRTRFKNDQIDTLLKIRWWDSQESEILKLIDDLEGDIGQFISNFHDRNNV